MKLLVTRYCGVDFIPLKATELNKTFLTALFVCFVCLFLQGFRRQNPLTASR